MKFNILLSRPNFHSREPYKVVWRTLDGKSDEFYIVSYNKLQYRCIDKKHEPGFLLPPSERSNTKKMNFFNQGGVDEDDNTHWIRRVDVQEATCITPFTTFSLGIFTCPKPRASSSRTWYEKELANITKQDLKLNYTSILSYADLIFIRRNPTRSYEEQWIGRAINSTLSSIITFNTTILTFNLDRLEKAQT